MGLLFSFFAVVALVVIVFVGVNLERLHSLFGILIPYPALLVFILGVTAGF